MILDGLLRIAGMVLDSLSSACDASVSFALAWY